jgi:small neutral amino acid transporter SnatA (MarC family)
MDHLLKATVTLLAVINPVVCGTIFHSPGFPWTALGAAGIASLVTLVVLLAAARVGSRSPGSQGMATRFMGLIVASMGLQFVLAGLKSYLG